MADTEVLEAEDRDAIPNVKPNLLTGNIGSPMVNEIMFKAIRLYPTCTPHPVPSPCYNAQAVNESVTNLTSCVNEMEYLKEQCVATLKPHAIPVAYDLLQCGLLTEDAVLELKDDEGNILVSELVTDQIEDDEEDEEEEAEDVESILQQETANKELDLALTYDKIKLSMSRLLIDTVYKEAVSASKMVLNKVKSVWLDRIKTTLDLNSITDVHVWLDKLIECIKNIDIHIMPQISKWRPAHEQTLNDPREVRLTTFEIWSEISVTLMDNLEVNEKLVDQLANQHIINEHTKLRLLCLPNRKSKVESLLAYLSDMGPTVMYMFGDILMETGQKPLGRIVIKQLKDNKIAHAIPCTND